VHIFNYNWRSVPLTFDNKEFICLHFAYINQYKCCLKNLCDKLYISKTGINTLTPLMFILFHDLHTSYEYPTGQILSEKYILFIRNCYAKTIQDCQARRICACKTNSLVYIYIRFCRKNFQINLFLLPTRLCHDIVHLINERQLV